MSPMSVFALCVVALAALQPAAALRCFSCDSQNDYTCDDPFRPLNRFAMIDCHQQGGLGVPQQGPGFYNGYPVCRKIKQRTVDGRPLVIRSCAWVDPNDGGRSACNQQSIGGYLHQEYCSICNSDLCNSAPRPAVPMVAILAAPLAALAFWMRR